MDGYEASSMPYLGNPMQYNHPVSTDAYLNTLPALGFPDHNFQQHAPSYPADGFGGYELLHPTSAPHEADSRVAMTRLYLHSLYLCQQRQKESSAIL